LDVIYVVVGVVCTVLALLVAAILYLIRAKQSKGEGTDPLLPTPCSRPPAPNPLLPTPCSLERRCLDTKFTAVLLQLLPGAERVVRRLRGKLCQEQSHTRFLVLVPKIT